MNFREEFKGNVTPKPLEQLGKKLKMLTKHNNTTESYIAFVYKNT